MDSHSIARNNAPTAISIQRNKLSRGFEIVKLLTLLAEARQAAVSPQTLELFSSELARHQAEDIEAAVRKLMYRKREEGETSFPDLATLDEEIRGFARIRRQAIAQEAQRKLDEAEARHMQEHPEEYTHVRDIWAEFMEKRSIQAPKPAPARPAPSHLTSAQMRELAAAIESIGAPSHLSPAQLRELADALEKQETRNAEDIA